jgi:hypothetical protein
VSRAHCRTSSDGDGSNEEWQNVEKIALETHVGYSFLQTGTFVRNGALEWEKRARLDPEFASDARACPHIHKHAPSFGWSSLPGFSECRLKGLASSVSIHDPQYI